MFESVEEVRDAVDRGSGVLTITMLELRHAHGAARLGVHVATNISKRLRSMGLDHYPKQLAQAQDETVRVYRQGTAIADLIDAVLAPSVEGDRQLRSAAGGEAQELLEAIRELVCE